MVGLYAGGEYDPKYLVSYVAVRARFDEVLELSWYPDVNTRFHEVRVTLPKSAFVACIGQYRHDGNPSIFVQSEWLRELYLRANSIFALIDAIGVEVAIRSGRVTRSRLLVLRDRIDKIAAQWPKVSFVSFGDSLLLKIHWWPGNVANAISSFTVQSFRESRRSSRAGRREGMVCRAMPIRAQTPRRSSRCSSGHWYTTQARSGVPS